MIVAGHRFPAGLNWKAVTTWNDDWTVGASISLLCELLQEGDGLLLLYRKVRSSIAPSYTRPVAPAFRPRESSIRIQVACAGARPLGATRPATWPKSRHPLPLVKPAPNTHVAVDLGALCPSRFTEVWSRSVRYLEAAPTQGRGSRAPLAPAHVVLPVPHL